MKAKMEALELALTTMLKRDEGRSPFAYRDSLGILTIGYGRNIDLRGGKGLSDSEMELLLANDVAEVVAQAKAYPFCKSLRPNQKLVVCSMLFQLGKSRFDKFKKFQAALLAGDYELAAKEMLNSKWAKSDSPARAKRLAALLLK